MTTLYWHDYETWGAKPSLDRPSQFAGVRTDENLNIISEPLVEYCQPPSDILPQPEACLVTGITPQKAQHEGLTESEFIAKIHAELSTPGTCGVGYNSIRFDDEVTRYTLFRNFYDPYEREWRNGNSRWDLIDVLRFCYATRPEGIEWPTVNDVPSFRLENITMANHIGHESAHDAYSDVEATIAVARLIKQKQPGLYDYAFRLRYKKNVAELIDVAHRKPFLHISSKFSAERGCAAIVAPITMHPVNKNAIIVFDLSVDPAVLSGLSPEDIRERIYTRQEDLPEGIDRLPLKLVHLNKSPIIATPKLVDASVETRTGIDKAVCEKHWQRLLALDVADVLQKAFGHNEFEPVNDPEQSLYDGFISNTDKAVSADLRRLKAEEIANHAFCFEDKRLNAMVLRYKARNFPGSLTFAEQAEWQEFREQRILEGGDGCLSLVEYHATIERLKEDVNEPEKIAVLQSLTEYGDTISASIRNS